MSKKLTPNVRFKGFSDDWEQRKVSNLAEKTYGGGTPKTNKPEFWDGNIPWIQSSDLALGKVSTVNTRKYITNDAIEESAAKIIPANSIAIVTRVGVGKVAFISFPYATSQDLLSRSSLTEDPVFSTFLFSKLMEKESQSTQGTSIKGVTKKKVLAERVRIPTTMSEQFNIGILLKSLDSTIASNQKQLDQLKMLKKLFLQKIFDQEWRFKGFTDPWEQRKLEQVVSNLRSYSLSRKVESSYPTHTKYIHYGDIHTRRAAKITSLSQLPDIIDGNYDYISYGDIAVADASEDYKDIAIPTILLSEDKNYSVVSGLHTIAFRPDKRMNPLFLYYLLFTQDFKHFVYREGQGLKVFGITKDNLFKYPISYPIKDEQNQVVQVFESLVSTIASNQYHGSNCESYFRSLSYRI